jgi:endogenous inhibitor of DNA gyrase (YacG/DUF329 family)
MKVSCPICRKEIDWEDNPFRPFCSERCKLVDLGRWATEAYRIPSNPEEESEESPSGPPDPEVESEDDDSRGQNGKGRTA